MRTACFHYKNFAKLSVIAIISIIEICAALFW